MSFTWVSDFSAFCCLTENVELPWQLLCHMIILLFLWDKKHLLKCTICHPHRTELSAFLLSFQGRSLLERGSASASLWQFFSRLLLFKNAFCTNCFSNFVIENNYSPVSSYMKLPEETQVTTELLQVISVYVRYTGLWVVACIMLKHHPRAWKYWKTLQFQPSLSSDVIVCSL